MRQNRALTDNDTTIDLHVSVTPYSGHIRTYPGIVEYEMIIAYRIVRRRIACRRARRRIACRRARRRIACRRARRRSRRPVWPVACRRAPSPDRVHQARHVPSRPSPGTASGMVVTCRRARRRIACGMARRLRTSRRVPARVCRSWSRLGTSHARHLPCPGPTYACRRRRQPLCCEHIFACTPWRFITARPAARLRRIVGPLASRKAVAGQSRQRDIIGHIRAYPGIVRTYSGHFRTFPDTRGSSRAVLPGAGYGDEDGRRVWWLKLSRHSFGQISVDREPGLGTKSLTLVPA